MTHVQTCDACNGDGRFEEVDGFCHVICEPILRTFICDYCDGKGEIEVEDDPATEIYELDERCGEGEFAQC